VTATLVWESCTDHVAASWQVYGEETLTWGYCGPCTSSALPLDVEKSGLSVQPITRSLSSAHLEPNNIQHQQISQSLETSVEKEEFCKMADNKKQSNIWKAQKRFPILFGLGLMSWKWMAYVSELFYCTIGIYYIIKLRPHLNNKQNRHAIEIKGSSAPSRQRLVLFSMENWTVCRTIQDYFLQLLNLHLYFYIILQWQKVYALLSNKILII